MRLCPQDGRTELGASWSGLLKTLKEVLWSRATGTPEFDAEMIGRNKEGLGLGRACLGAREGHNLSAESGSNEGPITLPKGSLRRQRWLSMPSDFNKLRAGAALTR